ncbi:MAG: hypothetical protein KTR23_14440 [Rhodospirillales bacterium]|nr:hypothetical protein [Rhodospirillales bacterium]
MRTQHPEIYTELPIGLGALRQTLFKTISRHCVSDIRSDALTDTDQIETTSVPVKVSTDTVPNSASEMYREVGLDVLTLSLLADVPIHRPRHLTQNSLVGHWRWLRQVWRLMAPLSDASTPPAHVSPAKVHHNIAEAIAQGRNNIAIALLRQSFQEIEDADAAELADSHQSFLANLTLFCPFIGTELLWRQGLITAPKAEGLIE